MFKLFVIIFDGCEWEDLIIFTDEEEAINYTKMYTHTRAEIFINGKPTYSYYKNGKLYQ